MLALRAILDWVPNNFHQRIGNGVKPGRRSPFSRPANYPVVGPSREPCSSLWLCLNFCPVVLLFVRSFVLFKTAQNEHPCTAMSSKPKSDHRTRIWTLERGIRKNKWTCTAVDEHVPCFVLKSAKFQIISPTKNSFLSLSNTGKYCSMVSTCTPQNEPYKIDHRVAWHYNKEKVGCGRVGG